MPLFYVKIRKNIDICNYLPIYYPAICRGRGTFSVPSLDGERYLTDKELSELLKLSRRTLQEYRKQGILPYIILCGKTLYPESEIQALLTGNYRKPIINGTVSQGEGTAS